MKIQSLRQNLKERPWYVVIVLVLTIMASVVWWNIAPDSSEGVVDDEYWGVQTPSTIPPGPIPDMAVDERMCPRDDPCFRTETNWVSPRRMATRFTNGHLGNSRGRLLPLRIQRLLTQDWNQDHNLKDADTVMAGTGCDHWWCKPLRVANCTVNIFMCAGDKIGWGNIVRVELRCGTQGFIGGVGGFLVDGPPGAAVGVGVGSGGCLYDQMGTTFGWW